MRTTCVWILILSFLTPACAAPAALGDAQQQASRIFEETGVRGGLIVHLGCGDGKLTAALGANAGTVVHGLGASADVAKARAHIRSLGLYGRISVEPWSGARLPYAEGTVNLLVAAELGPVPTAEVMRVLAPGGVAYVKKGDAWSKSAKPAPEGLDEWTHYLHDSSGNPVSHDRAVGPPRRAQWIGEPRFTRGHEFTPTVASLVSSGGRIFYLVDEAPVSSVLRPAQWQLVARDAYNGVLLWKQPISSWWPSLAVWTGGPRQLQRRLVAFGSRVYVTLGVHAPLVALDAAAGRLVKTYEQTVGTEEIVCHQGVLLLARRTVTQERTAELDTWARLSGEKDSPLFVRETAESLMKRLRGLETSGGLSLLALDADSGSVLWQSTGPEAAGHRALSLSALSDRVFYQKAGQIVCRELRTGKAIWQVAAPAPMRLVCELSVICADKKDAVALSAQTGEVQWKQEHRLCEVRDAFAINGSLWVGGFKPYQGKPRPEPAWGPYFVTQHDLATGEVIKEITPENPGHHHRCYSNKATNRFILGGRRGTEFIDLQSGEVQWNSFARGVCMYGIMPANGLLYAPPHSCACYTEAKLIGFYALAPEAKADGTSAPAGDRVEKGPAYAGATRVKAASPAQQASEWASFRHDPERSGSTTGAVSPNLHLKWQAELGGRLSALTVAGGKVLLASGEEHLVRALDAESGRGRWEYTAGARVDSPPAVYGDRALFGCRDGSVYSVRLSDGALAWRLRAARDDRRIVACSQLESVSPVHGSVLVRGDTVYAAAGRSSYLDGGIDLCRIEPGSGKLLSRTPIYSPDPKTGRQPPHTAPASMPGERSDILTADDKHIYLRDQVFGDDGIAQTEGSPHLLSVTDLLDDTWPHRAYWIFGTRCSITGGCSSRDKNLIYGRILSFDGSAIYAYGRKGVHWSNQFQDGAYRVFSVGRGDGAARWEKPVPIQVRAMVLASKVLFVAGPLTQAVGPMAEPDPGQGALLLALSAADGGELARCPLPSAPGFDGMAAAYGRLYLSTTDGKVLCLAGK